MARRPIYKTARCVLRCDGDFLLAVHSSFWAKPQRRWGLPGGGIERGEGPQSAVARELEEELGLYVNQFVEIGGFVYKGYEHMIYAADIEQREFAYDDTELLDLKWFDLEGIVQLADKGLLHAGYELRAIKAFTQR